MTTGRIPACVRCGGQDVRTWLDTMPLCDRCSNAVLSERNGWPVLPEPPEVETIAGPTAGRCVFGTG